MTSELALHAWIFLGNAFNLLLNRAPFAPGTQLTSSRADLQRLYASVEPLTPATILPALDQLTPEDRVLLTHACRWGLTNLHTDFDTLMGVAHQEAATVLAYLALEQVSATFPPLPAQEGIPMSLDISRLRQFEDRRVKMSFDDGLQVVARFLKATQDLDGSLHLVYNQVEWANDPRELATSKDCTVYAEGESLTSIEEAIVPHA